MITPPFDIFQAKNLAHLFTIVRGDESFRWTDAETDLTVGGFDFPREPGTKMSALEFNADGTPSNCAIQIAARTAGALLGPDAVVGRYDGYPIQIAVCDTGNPGAGYYVQFYGAVGTINVSEFGTIKIDCRGPLSRLKGQVSEKYSAMCRADLGDERCKIIILPENIQRNTLYEPGDPLESFVRVRGFSNNEPSDFQNLYWECTNAGVTAGSQPGGYAGATAGTVVTDGGAQFTARNAWLRYAEVASIPTPQSFILTGHPDSRDIDDFYNLGAAIVRTGRYTGIPIPIKDWTQSTVTAESFIIVQSMLEVGTLLEIYPGCAKTEAACQAFVNIINRRAEPFAPGRDAASATA